MTAKLSSRERVEKMFNRQDHDRIPRHDSFWPETITNWQAEGLDGNHREINEMLGNDLQQLCWSWPCPFPNRSELIEQDETTQVIIDQFGQKTREWKKRSGTPEHLGWECASRDTWEKIIKPATLAAGPFIDIDNVKRAYADAQKNNRWSFLAGIEAFEHTRKIMGDETTLIAMVTDPDWVRDVSKIEADLTIRDYQAILDAGVQPDGIWIYGDMAYNHATICSPQMYRELIWPDHKRLADFAHENNMKFIFHTDGDVNGVIDLYIEAGFDCLQPLEAKANMDVVKLVPVYGDKLAFFGNIDIMVLATNDRCKIEHEVKTKIEAGMATKGYMYHSDHSVPPSVTFDTYKFVIELLNKYGNYN